MNITVYRDLFNNCTLGKLYIDGTYQCETLEDRDRKLESGGKKVSGETCIPRGKYKVTIDYSNRFNRDLPHLLDVPDFTGVRIHSGNTRKDTSGCILLGQMRVNNNNIGYSRMAFDDFFSKLEKALDKNEQITIEIK